MIAIERSVKDYEKSVTQLWYTLVWLDPGACSIGFTFRKQYTEVHLVFVEGH